ncbi:MAG TPA: tetratricopeptide repeat protein, partial [Gemmataceae bacterium]|nr:tetratricopeptide repeat protein [Gemmataceae bacterium]
SRSAAGLFGSLTTASPPAAKANAKAAVFSAETPDDGKKDGPLAPATLVTFANTCVDAVANDPNKPAAEREQMLARARDLYQQALAREPKSVDALLGLGRMYHISGEAAKVAEVERRLKAEHPKDAKVWGWMAVRAGQAKQWDTAIQCYHTAAKLDPDNRVYRTHLGFTLARVGRYREGYEWLKTSMKEANARYSLAQMQIHNGHVEVAQEELARALEAEPGFKPARDQLMALSGGAAAAPGVRTVGHDGQ